MQIEEKTNEETCSPTLLFNLPFMKGNVGNARVMSNMKFSECFIHTFIQVSTPRAMSWGLKMKKFLVWNNKRKEFKNLTALNYWLEG